MDATTPTARRPQARPTTAIGWLLDEAERAGLLERFKPAYPDVIAHHVTLKMGVGPREALPAPCDAVIVGQQDDGAGLQCLVVEIDGDCRRWDGSVYHVTWSLDRARGRRPVESNGVIAWLGWKPVEPVRISLTPGRF